MRRVALALVLFVAAAAAFETRSFVDAALIASTGPICADPCPTTCTSQCAGDCAAGRRTFACRLCTAECLSGCVNYCDEEALGASYLTISAGTRAASTPVLATAGDAPYTYDIIIGHVDDTTAYVKRARLGFPNAVGGAVSTLLLAPRINCIQTPAYAMLNVTARRDTITMHMLWLYRDISCDNAMHGPYGAGASTPIAQGAIVAAGTTTWMSLPWGRCNSVLAWPCMNLGDCDLTSTACVAQLRSALAPVDGGEYSVIVKIGRASCRERVYHPV